MKRINSKPIWLTTKTKLNLVWRGIKPTLIFVGILLVVQIILSTATIIVFGEDFFDNGLRRFALFFSAFVIGMVIDEVRQQIIAINKRERDIIEIWVETQKKPKKKV